MDNSILRKRLNTFKSSKGSLTRISDEVILDVLRAWEQWPGTNADLYRELGIKKGQLGSIIRKAKKMIKNGAFIESEFKEIEMEEPSNVVPINGECNGAEVVWGDGKIIRFNDINLLVDFLKKTA